MITFGWQKPHESMHLVNKAGACERCGEKGNVFISSTVGDVQTNVCRECTSIEHASLLNHKDWLVFSHSGSQQRALQLGRLLQSMRMAEVVAKSDTKSTSTNSKFIQEGPKILPIPLTDVERKNYNWHDQVTLAIDKLSAIENKIKKLAAEYNAYCWTEYGLPPLHPDLPLQNILLWPVFEPRNKMTAGCAEAERLVPFFDNLRARGIIKVSDIPAKDTKDSPVDEKDPVNAETNVRNEAIIKELNGFDFDTDVFDNHQVYTTSGVDSSSPVDNCNVSEIKIEDILEEDILNMIMDLTELSNPFMLNNLSKEQKFEMLNSLKSLKSKVFSRDTEKTGE